MTSVDRIENSVYHDPQHASHIILPIIPATAATTSAGQQGFGGWPDMRCFSAPHSIRTGADTLTRHLTL